MSTEHDTRKGSTQYKWMENDLKAIDRKITPWLVFTDFFSCQVSHNFFRVILAGHR